MSEEKTLEEIQDDIREIMPVRDAAGKVKMSRELWDNIQNKIKTACANTD